MPLISVAIITCNEERNLARTLASVSFVDEVVVVDSGSTDRTLEIAESFGAKIFRREWPGFAPQKNFAIAQCTGDWVLSLDADEELSPELRTQLRLLLPTNPPADAYYIKRRNMFLGRWLKYGGYYPDPKLRLFRRSAAHFGNTPKFEERPVHETIVFSGESAYSTLGAQILVKHGRTSRSIFAFYVNTFITPCLSFIKNFIFRFGFLDGREGLMMHLYHSTYVSWKYAKAWQAEVALPHTAPSTVKDKVPS
jgi:glycosyltransferase involved in cell wall biosynthesis